MVITRKIQIYVCEPDSEKKKEQIHTIYQWRYWVRKAANMIVAHKFVQQEISEFLYIKDEVKEKFYVKHILKEGPGMSEQNTTYRLVSGMLKGKVPSDIYSCLNQAVAKTFKETVADINRGKASLRSYKNNIPIPFSAKALSNIHYNTDDKRFYFTLFGLPFACMLGKDRNNNQVILERCISGQYKLCSSSIQIDDKKKKIFLLLCVDMPQQQIELKEDKVMYAYLSVLNPIVCSTDVTAKNEFDSGKRMFAIGTKEEFLHRRTQIQQAVRRCQIESRYNTGGRGRGRKLEALDRFREKEKHYVNTKLHLYARKLVDMAVKHKCGTIILMDQKNREETAKADNEIGEPFVLRNWSYYGLKEKIGYKAKMLNITVKTE